MALPQIITVAAAQYPIDYLDDWDAFAAKSRRWVSEAVGEYARVLVLPEYGSMELVSLLSPELQADVRGQLRALQDFHAPFLALYRQLAQDYHAYIVAPSFPVEVGDGDFRNRAYFCAPGGEYGQQDKLLMTRFEDESWGIRGSDQGLTVFRTEYGVMGIQICYDSEFPLPTRALVEAGAEVILVPSCTETLAGYHRVRIGSQARALENQCYCVHSPTVGEASWSPAVDMNTGAAGVYTPADIGFPADGVLAQGQLNRPGWVYASLDMDRIRRVRADGTVLNHRHWPLQSTRLAGGIDTLTL